MSDLGNKQVFAENLKRVMHKYGISRQKLASDLGFSYTTLSSWLQGANYPRIDKIEMIANYFHISKADLVEKYSSQPNEEKTQVDLKEPHIFSYGGKPISDDDMEIIRSILERHRNENDN